MSIKSRPSFRDWVDSHSEPEWSPMPLTHITRGLDAQEIIRQGAIEPRMCSKFKKLAAYFFYARPAYRLADGAVVKLEAACPFCFILRDELIGRAEAIHAFDTGAFFNRLYAHVLTDDFRVDDYLLGVDAARPNKLIAATFGSMSAYFDGDRTKVKHAGDIPAWEMLARAYLELIASPGRNEPDDRICSIEVMVAESISLKRNLRAVIVPHTCGMSKDGRLGLSCAEDDGATIVP